MQMLKGHEKLGFRLNSRLPITLPILHRILASAVHFCHSQYDIVLFQAMCSLAFFGCRRVGEITLTTSKGGGSPFQIHQLTQSVAENQKVVALKCTFLDFKCSLRLSLSQKVIPGPLFVLGDGSPVSIAAFTEKLSMAIKYCGFEPSRYKGHSFRIGAASHAADAGMSDAQIRALERWKSNAFQKYIRIPSISS